MEIIARFSPLDQRRRKLGSTGGRHDPKTALSHQPKEVGRSAIESDDRAVIGNEASKPRPSPSDFLDTSTGECLDPIQEAFVALDPPDQLADLHTDLLDLHAHIITAQQAFSERAQTSTALEELDQSSEAQAYRAMQTEALALCQELQARIDATADLEIVFDTPWLSTGREVVRVAFGC